MYVVEGIGYDFVPDVLSRDKSDVDAWIKTSDDESFAAVQVLMRNEGLLVGGSSGSALSGAVRWLLETEEGRKLASKPEANVVILLPDGCAFTSPVALSVAALILRSCRIRNYMSKPWFLKIAMETPPTPLTNLIAKVLQT